MGEPGRVRPRRWMRFLFRAPHGPAPGDEAGVRGQQGDAAAPASASAPAGEGSGEPSPPAHRRGPRFFRVREPLAPQWRVLLSLLPFVVFVAWWVWATAGASPELRRISPYALPSPGDISEFLPSLWYDSALMRNILVSLVRVGAGFALAVAIALPLGVAMGSFTRVGATFSLVETVLGYLPIAAIVPLTMAWWHSGEKQKVGFLALATFAYLLPLIVRHVRKVDHQYLLAAYAQGATAWQVVFRVLVPIALPDILNSLRLGLGVGWTYIVLCEVIKEGEGMGGVGNLILVFQRLGKMQGVYPTVVAIMLVGALLDRACAKLWTWFFPYRAGLEAE